jgi:hypothetical protein
MAPALGAADVPWKITRPLAVSGDCSVNVTV